jgi:hypothetical protein
VDDGPGPATPGGRGKLKYRTGLVCPAKLRGSVEISLGIHDQTRRGLNSVIVLRAKAVEHGLGPPGVAIG